MGNEKDGQAICLLSRAAFSMTTGRLRATHSGAGAGFRWLAGLAPPSLVREK